MASPVQSALDVALSALRHRDLSVAAVEQRLAARGFSETQREEAVATLRRTGLVDDSRYAELRAGALAGRGAGDAFIRRDLELGGVAREVADQALDHLEPETQRARRIVARRGEGPKTARYLAGKGFSEETIAACAAPSRAAADSDY